MPHCTINCGLQKVALAKRPNRAPIQLCNGGMASQNALEVLVLARMGVWLRIQCGCCRNCYCLLATTQTLTRSAAVLRTIQRLPMYASDLEGSSRRREEQPLTVSVATMLNRTRKSFSYSFFVYLVRSSWGCRPQGKDQGVTADTMDVPGKASPASSPPCLQQLMMPTVECLNGWKEICTCVR